MNPDDRDRIDAFLHGDGAVTREITAWVRGVVRHRAWRLDRTDDLVQDVLLRLIETLGRGGFEGRSSLRTFVERVAKYTCLDAVRRERRHEFVEFDDATEPLVAANDDVLERIDSDERARLCYAVLDQLPAPCRELLQRTLAEDMRYEELAAADDVAVGTIKSRVARCRERANRLREHILAEPRRWRKRDMP